MAQYVYQRTGGPLINWTPGAPPRGYRAAETRALGQAPQPGANFGLAGGCGGGGGCGCSSCGGGPKGGLGGGYPEYGGHVRAIAVPTGQAVRYAMGEFLPEPRGAAARYGMGSTLPEPRGQTMRYTSSLGTVPFIPGAPEPLTGATPADVNALIDPYPSAGFPWKTVIVGGLALAVAWPYLKKAMKK